MERKGLPERCRGCIHCGRFYVSSELDRVVGCYYILDRYEPRGCAADESCTRFEPGVRGKEWFIEPLYCR